MSGRGRGRFGPPPGGRYGGRKTNMQARDADFGGRGRGRGKWKKTLNGNYMGNRDGSGQGSTSKEESNAKLAQVRAEDELEASFGFALFTSGEDRLGWLMNMQPSCMEDKDSGHIASAVDCYFMCQDGSMFKARMPFAPYFYVQVTEGMEFEVEGQLRKRYESMIRTVDIVSKEDLDLKNHLSGIQRKLLRLSFWNVQQLMEVKREVGPYVTRSKAKARTTQAYTDMAELQGGVGEGSAAKDPLEHIMDMREYDVPYHVRFAIDLNIRCAQWFTVKCKDGVTTMTHRADLLQRAEPRICAWDIETTKLPLQFPNAEYDQVFMISYMIDKQGYLITNREVVGGDISNFEFTPKPEFEGPFIIFNEPDEIHLLKRFFKHMQEVKPAIYVTYNGDFFDFPFVEKRATFHGMDLYKELGFRMATNSTGEVLARHAVHMDCLHWVNRDSYLPQGSRGLKAVTKAKLGYDPVEVNPEDMLKMAQESPQAMASYSVSDAVSTYYLYMTYIHPFIFSLATIIPLPPDEVLRKGSGTLCEQLLMVEAYMKNIICPNKHVSQSEIFYKGHLLESETYIGGKVEAIEAGVFRSDLPMKFKCQPSAYQGLIDKLDRDLTYAIKVEGKMEVEDIVNYNEIKEAIATGLASLRDTPNREETPLIYHLDVAAMYPNIILTNRLQPSAIVTDEDCAACDFNQPDKTCLRQMEWVWRGEHYAASKNEYLAIKTQLQAETFPPAPVTAAALAAAAARGEPAPVPQPRMWDDLSVEEKDKLVTERLKKYTQKVYKRVLDKPVTEQRLAGICQRENSFYVDTVRAFRDRRYEYKGLNKVWKGKLDSAKSEGAPLKIQAASDMVVLYDSLQLAHKCILNSFYGYVMRKGARWYSMEMAGVVTYTGANIIQRANALVTQLGRPLELDTDGIWCALPSSFPENYRFKNKNGKDLKISYPCVMLNVLVADHNTNPQYQTLVDPVTKTYVTSSEMSIEFEVDGPYKAMVLPASKEEGKSIKKRYAVFNFDGTLAELKGFEVKRRGELKLIKVFQAEVFKYFLEGSTLMQCYAAVASVANRWLDMLDTQGTDLTDEELIEYISEATTMSKGLEEYEGRKSCAITCAKRLGQFLGDERIKDKGLNCCYVIARKPENSPTSERAIPVSIFSAEPAVARTYLRQWCGDIGSAPANCVPDVRDIVDWGYYRERLGGSIQKIITIPAAMQGVANPCPRIRHPDWLQRKVAQLNSKSHQTSLLDLLPKLAKKQPTDMDMEDLATKRPTVTAPGAPAQPPATPTAITLAEGRGRKAGVRQTSLALTSGGGEPTTTTTAVGGENQDPNTLQGQQGSVTGGTTKTIAPQPKPPLSEGYQPWMEHQKDQWRQQREARKRRRADAAAAAKIAGRRNGGAGGGADGTAGQGKGGAVTGAGIGDLGAMLRQQASVITSATWQVLQLAETRTPGRFKMWFVANSQMHHVHVLVPRVFYIDSEVPLDSDMLAEQALMAARAGGAAVGTSSQPVASTQLQAVLGGLRDASCVKAGSKVLPGGKKPQHLYKVSLSEDQYQSHLMALSAVLSAPHIRGLYEERVPLVLNAVLRLGCITRLTPAAASKPLSADYTLEDFQAPTLSGGYLEEYVPQQNKSSAATVPFLLGQQQRPSQTQPVERPQGPAVDPAVQPLGPHMKHVVLFCSGEPTQGRAVYCLYMPAAKRCMMVIVQQSATAARELTPPLMERAWREAYTLHRQQQGLPVDNISRMELSVEYARDSIEAGGVLQRALGAHRAELRGKILVAVQGPSNAAALATSGMLPVLDNCPCVDIPHHADDSKYPALQWQARAARRAMLRVLDTGLTLAEKVALARYAAVPVAHLAGDASVSVADIAFARGLRAADHLLWIKDNSAPDLGVEDKDDGDAQLSCLVAGLGATVCGLGGSGPGTTSGAGTGGLANTPGLTPELLAPGAYRSPCAELRVNHLSVAAVLQAASLGDLEGAASVEGASGPAGPAFKVLTNLVQAWLTDATSNMNRIADFLLLSLYRWLSWPGSMLYDPALQRALQGVMSKLFAQLVSEMRKLGAQLVSANFNRIIIATGKKDITSAVSYVRYLLEALKRREMFVWVELVPQAWWHALLFRDAYNWGGIHAVVQEGEVTTAHQTGGDDDIDGTDGAIKDGALRYQWSLSTYLPPAIQQEVDVVLNQFLYLPWKEAREGQGKGAKEGGEQAEGEGAQAVEDPQLKYLIQAVPNLFTQQLLKTVGDAQRLMPVGSERPEHQFPVLAGSHLSEEELGSPALAFVRIVSHVLSLDTRCADSVAVLRRQLLRLLHVREFSSEADFRELCLALRLPDVICSYCNDCRDLDLCRDAELLAQGQAGTGWTCRQCSQAYDMAAMERRMVGALQQHVRDYQLQDLQCVRCRAVASSHLHASCTRCGSNLAETVQAQTFRKKLTVFRSAAKHHGFGVLQELSEWLLKR